MSIQGIVLVDLMGLGLIFLILNLVRIKNLYIGYAAIWFLAISGLMLIVSIPSVLSFLPRLVGAVYPASAISLLAFGFIFLVLIFMSVQLSILSTRQVELIQALAIKELTEQEE
jgi:hypothetical protein